MLATKTDNNNNSPSASDNSPVLPLPTVTLTSLTPPNPYHLNIDPPYHNINDNNNILEPTMDINSLINANTYIINAISTYIGNSFRKRYLFKKELRAINTPTQPKSD